MAGFFVTLPCKLLLLGGFLLRSALLLRGLLGAALLLHGHGTISSTGVEHPCDPPVDRRANDCEPRLTADSLCARTARMNALRVFAVLLSCFVIGRSTRSFVTC